jgi:hypothetical protein
MKAEMMYVSCTLLVQLYRRSDNWGGTWKAAREKVVAVSDLLLFDDSFQSPAL